MQEKLKHIDECEYNKGFNRGFKTAVALILCIVSFVLLLIFI